MWPSGLKNTLFCDVLDLWNFIFGTKAWWNWRVPRLLTCRWNKWQKVPSISQSQRTLAKGSQAKRRHSAQFHSHTRWTNDREKDIGTWRVMLRRTVVTVIVCMKGPLGSAHWNYSWSLRIKNRKTRSANGHQMVYVSSAVIESNDKDVSLLEDSRNWDHQHWWL